MSLFSMGLLSWRKPLSQRVAVSVVAVFMLQVIAVGFCVSTAHATATPMVMAQSSDMNHCNHVSMAAEKPMGNETQAEHVCAHCDFPDVNLVLDKQVLSFDDVTSVLLYVMFVPSVQSVEVEAFTNLSPPLRTSLFTFDLNQRIRV